jgi:glycogen(starch) synthase
MSSALLESTLDLALDSVSGRIGSPGMRVLELSWEYPPLTEGGLARHVCGLSEALVAQGAEVHVLSRGPDTGVSEQRGVVVHRVAQAPFPRDVDAFLMWVAELNRTLQTVVAQWLAGEPFDVVHSHDWLVADVARTVAADAGLPWVVTVHATEHGRHGGFVARPPQSTIHGLERAMARDADHLITCSHWMRDHVAAVFGVARNTITALPNGIDLDALAALRRPAGDGDDAALRARLAPGGERLVLLAGRLVHEKGFDLALDALAPILHEPRSRADHHAVRFVVAGAGPAEDALHAQSQGLGLDPHGRFLGWVDDATLHALYRVCDVCVVPSRYEPFGIVALEAMALGCACIVADTGGLREIVPGDETVGLRVPREDRRVLTAAITRLLHDDALRAGIRERARRHVRGYGWAPVARATAELLDALARSPAHHPAPPLSGSAAPAFPRSR